MRYMTLNVLQTVVVIALVLWIIGLGIAVISQQHQHYFQWTGRTLRGIWQRSWQFLLGLVIGYWLCGAPLLGVS
jgi:hypothetical protein